MVTLEIHYYILFRIILGVYADDKTWILNDSWILGKILICHKVLHKLFWSKKECRKYFNFSGRHSAGISSSLTTLTFRDLAGVAFSSAKGHADVHVVGGVIWQILGATVHCPTAHWLRRLASWTGALLCPVLKRSLSLTSGNTGILGNLTTPNQYSSTTAGWLYVLSISNISLSFSMMKIGTASSVKITK